MRSRKFTFKLGAAALVCTALSLASGQAIAAEYWLSAGTTTVSVPSPTGTGTVGVPMWGYASCASGFANCGPVTVPGPALTVPPGDATLTVHLRNTLSVPTSLVINGLIKPMTPVWTEPGSSTALPSRGTSATARVRSFDFEAQPNRGTQADYTWGSAAKPVPPGTYLYQSGTQPQVQVQMGLYGAVAKNVSNAVAATATDVALAGQAYPGTGYAFNNEITLIYSEIDPDLHAAVGALGTYGTYGTTGPKSTINYEPKYFLINGQPYQFGASVIEPAGSPGTTLLRLLNAGLTTHVPMIQGKHWDVIAEDGKPYSYRRTQYTALLPAAKTLDALLTPDVGATYPILDRRLSLSNNGVSDGGMLAFLRFASLGAMSLGGGAGSNAAPLAGNDTYDSVAGVVLNVAAPGVLANDTDADSPIIKAVASSGATAQGGTYTLSADGAFSYAPLATYAGAIDSFTYQATDGKALSGAATVTIKWATPIAPAFGSVLDNFNVANANSLGANWSQQVGTMTSVPDVGISGSLASAATTTLGGLAIWNSSAGAFPEKQGASATLSEGAYLVLKASGGTTTAPANYVRVGCEGGQIVASTMMGGSNISVAAKQASFGSCGATGNLLRAAIDAKGLVTVFAGSTFVGGVQLPDVAAWKGPGRIGIQLTTVGATADDFAGGTLP
jgi:FtsP/CotA-like multicopper oxidase with cupredoxin domain